MNYKKLSILVTVPIMIGMTIGCTKPAAPVNPSESPKNNQPEISSSPISSPSPSVYIETYKDETHTQIQYGELSFDIANYHHIVYHAQSNTADTYKCDINTGLDWEQPRKISIIVMRKMEKQDFSDTESIAAYLRELSPNYERIDIYDDVADDSGIIGLYSITGGGITNYIVHYTDACYFIESDYSYLDLNLFESYPEENYQEDRQKIECADSFITDVNQTVYYHEEEFERADYDITQGKDGTKYSAQLIGEKEEYHFTLQNANDENLLTLSTYGSFYDVIKFIDVNMDGYADVQFLEEPGTWNNSYALYVWDDSTQSFVKVQCDEMLSTIDVYDGYVLNWQKEDIESGVVQKLVWDGNTLVLESEEPYCCGE